MRPLKLLGWLVAVALDTPQAQPEVAPQAHGDEPESQWHARVGAR
jgi:hypothetical protein